MEKRQPKRRFKDFQSRGDWEEKKLGEITNYANGKAHEKNVSEKGSHKLINLNAISIDGKLKDSGKYISNPKTTLLKNDLVMILSDVGHGNLLGRVAVIPKNDKYVLNQRVALLRIIDNTDPYYLYYSINNNQIYFKRKGAGMSQLNISKKSVENFKVPIPPLEEQKKIGDFFQRLDRLIDLNRSRLDKLRKTKEAYLVELFPREGESYPRRRFPGFTGPWEEKKLGDVADIVRGASPRPIEDPKWFDSKSDVGWLRISDVTEQNGRIYELEQRLSMLGQEHTRVVKKPHILMSIAGSVGKPVINYISTGVHDGFLIFLNLDIEIEFLFQWLDMFKKKWKRYGQPGSQVNLNSNIVKSQKVLIPSLEEQKKIGDFFQRLDGLIAKEEERLDKLENLKKAYLNELFV